MRIAFLTIATNKYTHFAQDLYNSINIYRNNYPIDLICFTNKADSFSQSGLTKLQTIDTNHIPFPMISLLRYHYYASQAKLLSWYDYIYHIDCDMLLTDYLSDEFLGERVCVIHPSYTHPQFPSQQFPYDRNEKSGAFIPYGYGDRYYQNCFQGGSSNEFVTMCKTLQIRIEQDLRNNYIALWHDESYMNRYMAENPPTKELPPTYAQPENWPSFGSTKILHRDKNHTEIRSI